MESHMHRVAANVDCLCVPRDRKTGPWGPCSQPRFTSRSYLWVEVAPPGLLLSLWQARAVHSCWACKELSWGSWNASRFTVCPSHYRRLRVFNIYDYSRHCKCHLPHVFHLLLSCIPCTLTTRIMAMIKNVNQSPSHQRTVALQHEGLPAGLSRCPSSHPTRNAGRRRNAASSTLMAVAISTPTALQVARQLIHTN